MTRQHKVLLLARITLAVALSAAVVVLTVSMSSLSGRIQAQQILLGRSLHAQTHNRASNVAVWCNAINQSRDYNRSFVRVVSHNRLAYALRDLPCRALEQNTLASTKPHK